MDRTAESKTCVVTGGTSGVGRAIARGLARAGATVVIAARDQARGEASAALLRAETGNPAVEFMLLDLADPGSVRAFVEAFSRRHGALHVLSNNAAHLVMDRRVTAYGAESIFSVNYLGHFLLTNLLMDALKAGAPSRVATVAGGPGMLKGRQLDLEAPLSPAGFSPLRATVHAALAKVLFTFELARRLEGTGVTANTFHPGIVRSGLPRHLPWFLRLPAALAMALVPEECPTGVFLCLAPELEGVSGRFFVGRKPAAFAPAWNVAEAGQRLWEQSERLAPLG
jgi:NAD(P)-dependent dehydrogenase (short-subunit alcohol dehydrogenase family)